MSKNIFVDGYTFFSNPSQTGGGYVIINGEDKGENITHQKINKVGLTNNEIELRAVLEAAKIASEGDTILTDSQVAILWSKRGTAPARSDLNDICAEIKSLVEIKKLTLVKCYREENLAGKLIEKMGMDAWVKKWK